MLYALMLTLYIFVALLILALVLIQPGKDSMGLGSLGGGTQMLFGGSGGQSFLQKATWVLGALFMGLSLYLAIMKSSSIQRRYLPSKKDAPIVQEDPQETPEPKQEGTKKEADKS